MPFCYRCGENVPPFDWDVHFNACRDCVAIYDFERFLEITPDPTKEEEEDEDEEE